MASLFQVRHAVFDCCSLGVVDLIDAKRSWDNRPEVDSHTTQMSKQLYGASYKQASKPQLECTLRWMQYQKP